MYVLNINDFNEPEEFKKLLTAETVRIFKSVINQMTDSDYIKIKNMPVAIVKIGETDIMNIYSVIRCV